MREVILVFLLCVYQIPTSNLEWCESHKITWEDFRGEVDQASSYVANINTSIHVRSRSEIGKPPEYIISANMNREKSWKKLDASSKLLEHEQLHFDICELYVRNIRKVVDSLNVTGVLEKGVYKEKITALMRNERARNSLYDEETNHSKDLMKQSVWEDMITKELEVLKKYASIPEGCK